MNINPGIKVALVSPFPPPFGGIASYAENLFNGLRSENIKTVKYHTTRYERFRYYNPDNQRNYSRILQPSNLLFLFAILFDFFFFLLFLLKSKPSVVHVHTSSFFGWWRSIIYILLSNALGKKTILHVHNAIDRFYIQESGTIGKSAIRVSLKIPDYIIVLSNGIKGMLSHFTKRPIKSIYNGVEVSLFNNIKQYHKPYRMLFAGFVGPHKGVPDLLYAMKATGLEHKELLLTVMGGGDVQEMRELSEELDLQDQVTFTGRISEKEKLKLFKSHHVFVLPSHGEGQPISILEAMASGMAVLSTSVGTIPEIITGGKNGFLVEKGDINALTNAIKEILIKNRPQTFGNNNKEMASDHFSFDRVVRDNISVYKELSKKDKAISL